VLPAQLEYLRRLVVTPVEEVIPMPSAERQQSPDRVPWRVGCARSRRAAGTRYGGLQGSTLRLPLEFPDISRFPTHLGILHPINMTDNTSLAFVTHHRIRKLPYCTAAHPVLAARPDHVSAGGDRPALSPRGKT
jgi:hypothetical protein